MLLESDELGGESPTPTPPCSLEACQAHLPGSHIAAEGVSMAAASQVQLTLVDGHADTTIPTPAFVAHAVVGAPGPRDTLSL